MKYFVVFQNQTFEQEFKAGILWAPKKDKNGVSSRFFWESMNLAKKGDVVFSVVKNYIVTRSIVTKEAVDYHNPLDTELWSRDGWLVKVDYDTQIDNIRISDHIDQLRDLLPDHHSPFRKSNGYGNQGYLFPISNELGNKLDQLINAAYVIKEDNDIFTVSEEEAEIIGVLFDEEGVDQANVIILESEIPETSNKPLLKQKMIHGRKIDFIEKAKKDAKTGLLGEELVVNYEKDFLIKNHRTDLAEKVKWVAKEADGYGYDVLSYDLNGNEKYIEVKTTKLDKDQPFEISANELRTSYEFKDQYWIYRIFSLDTKQPEFYKTQGEMNKHYDLEPTSFKAYIKKKEEIKH